MKKIKFALIGMILLYISTMFAEEVTLYYITPCILLPWVIYISINLDYKLCLTYTFFISLGKDLLNPQLLGFTTILYLLLAHCTHKYHTSFNKDKYSTIILSMLVINTIFYAVQWIYFSFSSPTPIALLGKLAITIVYNTILSCILLLLIYIADKLKIVIYD